MPIIEVEGQQFDFPDGTPDEVIGQAIRSHFSGQAATQQAPVQQPQQAQPADLQTQAGQPQSLRDIALSERG
ncbi:MAG: hypothetical protein V3T88_07060, partial [Nitrosomonadaceae bacterium]